MYIVCVISFMELHLFHRFYIENTTKKLRVLPCNGNPKYFFCLKFQGVNHQLIFENQKSYPISKLGYYWSLQGSFSCFPIAPFCQ